MKRNQILGVKFDDFEDKNEFLLRLPHEYNSAKSLNVSKLISYLNVQGLNLAYSNKKFKNVLNSADILFFDSVGLRIVTNLFYKSKVSFALTPPEWMHDFFKILPPGTRLFFIGDRPDVIAGYNNLFLNSFQHITSVGYHHGFFLKDKLLESDLIDKLKSSAPDVVIVGMGMPIQEFWIDRINGKVNVPLFIPVGAYYQRMLGIQKRPSIFISSIGMEWLYRFCMDPKRLFKRYIIGNPLFIFRILRHKAHEIKKETKLSVSRTPSN